MAKIVCAISGGVDSAVAALLLKRRGFNVTGAFMRNWDLRDETGHCSTEEDFHFAEKVCDTLDIPFHEVNFVKEYWTNVFQETLDEYESGRTPNPDVLCNKYIKFHAFYEYAKEKLNIGNIATGHYARTSDNFCSGMTDFSVSRRTAVVADRVHMNNGKLYQAVDQGKCQTFFLNRITSEVIKNTIFPVGGMLKKSVKELARMNGLGFVSKRKESMGICFIGLRDFDKFILDYIPPKKGNFVCLETGKNICEHDGYFKYTLGQRARISVDATAYFVVGKNIRTGDVYVVPGTLHHALFSNSIITESPHWINETPLSFRLNGEFECGIRVMHREPIARCEMYSLSNGRCLMILDRPLRSATPGQSAVIYSGLRCLGGTKISNVGPSYYESYHGYPNWSPFRDDIDLWDEVFEKFGDKILLRGTGIGDVVANYNHMLEDYKLATFH